MMQATRPDIKEEFTTTLWEHGTSRFCLRVIKFVNQQGVPVTKFGLSEYWFCAQLDKWLPSKKHHVFLPIDTWTALTSHSKAIEGFLTQHQLTQPKPNGGIVVRPRGNDEPSVPVSSQSSAPACDEKRRRGRPPKRANGATTGGGSQPSTSGGAQSAKKPTIIIIKKGAAKSVKEDEAARVVEGLRVTRGADENDGDGALGAELELVREHADELTGEFTVEETDG